MRILVTGATGQLGSEIRKRAANYPYEFVFTSSKDLDLTDLPRVSDIVRFESFTFIVNCAGYTAVDKAEQEPELAYKLNSEAIFNIVEAAEWVGTKVIHISTDYVFDGKSYRPYKEDDPINPLSVYAKSKAQGEKFVLKYPAAMIIRTSWLYSSIGNNFVKTMLRLAAEKDQISVVYDQIGTPTWAGDLAQAILFIIDGVAKHKFRFPSGIFHFSNEGVASWYDFAKAIFDLAGLDIDVKPIETKDFPRPAKRPMYSVLSKEKFKNYFKYQIPYWRDSLKIVINQLLNRTPE